MDVSVFSYQVCDEVTLTGNNASQGGQCIFVEYQVSFVMSIVRSVVRELGALLAVMLCLLGHTLPAQQIDLSLHATAVPDSFEVRATSTGTPFTAVPNGTFTVRWEAAAGGSIANEDVRPACGAYALLNYGGTVDIAAYRYFTLNLFGSRPVMNECPITTDGMSIGGFRINGLSGCRHVQLVQNAYTGMNNLDYHFSVGGIQVTGQITSDPIPGGACGPCDPPVIISASAVRGPGCNGPIELAAEAEGTALDFSWYGLYSGLPLAYLASYTIPSGPAGPFVLVVNGSCGTDSMVVQVDVDIAACVPPVITTATYSFIGAGIRFSTTATGTCLNYKVVAPNGNVYSDGWNGNVTCPHSAGLGEYLAITYNPCGADTAVFLIDENPQCNPPQIFYAVASVPSCQFSPLTLACNATGAGTLGYEWKDPYGTVVGTTATATVPEAMTGDYSITVSSDCGSNWTMASLVLDTAGIGGCVLPQILSITTNSPICAGDTLLLQAEVIADGPCLNYEWSGNSVLQSDAPATMAPSASGVNYSLTVSNACGTVAMTVQPAIVSQQNKTVVLCSPAGLLSLDSLANMTLPPGSWSLLDELHSAFYDPAVDTTGQYIYHHTELGCAVLRMSIREYDAVYAGADTAITVCNTDPPTPLFPLLGAGAMPGGSWSIGIGAFNGTYDPAIHNSNTCRYVVMNGGCNDMAYVYVTKIPATPWYADADGDGYGDDTNELLACEQPEGHVAEGGDTCPTVFGLMGDECDDGDPATVNDVINAECICQGQLPTGITEHGSGGIALWPNPNRGDGFFLQVPQASGPVYITVTDATGRVVLRTVLPASSAQVEVLLPGGISAGSYVVGIVTDGGSEVRRLVVER